MAADLISSALLGNIGRMFSIQDGDKNMDVGLRLLTSAVPNTALYRVFLPYNKLKHVIHYCWFLVNSPCTLVVQRFGWEIHALLLLEVKHLLKLLSAAQMQDEVLLEEFIYSKVQKCYT